MLDARPSLHLPTGAKVTYQQQYRRCARRHACRTCSQGKGHGPYWYAYWRQDGRVCSRYLGKERPVGPAAGAVSVPQVPATKAAAPGTLRITTLGGFAVWQSGRCIPSSVWTRRRMATALLQSLLCAPGSHLAREVAIERIWRPERDRVCEARLDYTIHTLNDLLGRPPVGAYVWSRGKQVVLAPSGQDATPVAWLDACAFEQAARAACQGSDAERCRLALALYTGVFLPEVCGEDSEPDRWDYTHYVIERRNVLQGLYTDLLLHLAGLTTSPFELINCLQEILRTDPCDERAAAALMRHYLEGGWLAQAKAVYRSLERALRAAQDETPCAEIRRLRRQVDVGGGPVPALQHHSQAVQRQDRSTATAKALRGTGDTV